MTVRDSIQHLNTYWGDDNVEVSFDYSTGEDDAFARMFGSVIGVQPGEDGPVILVESDSLSMSTKYRQVSAPWPTQPGMWITFTVIPEAHITVLHTGEPSEDYLKVLQEPLGPLPPQEDPS